MKDAVNELPPEVRLSVFRHRTSKFESNLPSVNSQQEAISSHRCEFAAHNRTEENETTFLGKSPLHSLQYH